MSFLFLVTVLSSVFGCISASQTPSPSIPGSTHSIPDRTPECLPEFPDAAGWYGGDAAFSVPLPTDDGRVSLWLFGDSFVERVKTPGQRAYPFVHNTIGLSQCDADGNWSFESFWRRDDPELPRAFFVPDLSADWVRAVDAKSGPSPYYWPFGGFVVHDTLFIGLLRVVSSEPRGHFNLPFRLAGMDLARIENFRDAPDRWRVQISALSNDLEAFPGSAFALSSSHLHAFAFFDREDGHAPRMLSRIELDALKTWRPDLTKRLESLGTDRRWRKGFEPDDAMILMQDDASEMSVHFDAGSGMWIAVYSPLTRSARGNGSTPILIRTAARLIGPWSEPEELMAIPETLPENETDLAENLFCYAGKAHRQFSSDADLVVTYVCNLFATHPQEAIQILDRLRTSLELYRPRAVRVPRGPNDESGLQATPELNDH